MMKHNITSFFRRLILGIVLLVVAEPLSPVCFAQLISPQCVETTLNKARAGDSRAQGLMAEWYRSDLVTNQINLVTAVDWAKAAAQKEEPFGLYALGRYYIDGRGMSRNIEKGRHRLAQSVAGLRKAASNRDPDAECFLGHMRVSCKGEQFTMSPAGIYQHVPDEFALNVEGVSKDNSKAAKWYSRSAKQGNVVALFCLGWLYTNGNGVKHSVTKGKKYYLIAAKQGFSPAQCNMGFNHSAFMNYKKAAMWTRKAAEQGLAIAQFNLGKLHTHGLGVTRNAEEATKWYRKAFLSGEGRALSGFLGVSSNKQISSLSAIAGLKITSLDLSETSISDLSPLKGMPLRKLNLHSTSIKDLSPLQGMPLIKLVIDNCPINNLSPLKGMPIEELYAMNTRVSNLEPLKKMPLQYLSLDFTQITDLTPLQETPLVELHIDGTRVTDLTPLRGKQLRRILLSFTPVKDLSPLLGQPIKQIDLYKTNIEDLSPLEGMPLERIHIDPRKIKKGLDVIRAIKSISFIAVNPYTFEPKMSAKEFWSLYDSGQLFTTKRGPALLLELCKYDWSKTLDMTTELGLKKLIEMSIVNSKSEHVKIILENGYSCYAFNKDGVEVFVRAGKIAALSFYRNHKKFGAYKGDLPPCLTWSDTMKSIQNKFGAPCFLQKHKALKLDELEFRSGAIGLRVGFHLRRDKIIRYQIFSVSALATKI